MAILAVDRKASHGLYCEIAKRTCPGEKIITLSDFRGVATIWSGTFLYRSEQETNNLDCEGFEDEIIARCRFLRSIKKDKAKKLVCRFWNGIETLFEEFKVSAVFQPMVDNYTLDIIAHIAEIRKIPVVSFVGHLFNGYFRITVRGELNPIRFNVSRREIENVKNQILKTAYKPDFDLMKEKSQCKLTRLYFRRRVIESVYYPVLKKIEHDPDNYHYNTLLLKGKTRELVSKNRYAAFLANDDVLSLCEPTSVYLPLHMVPEATTDYWCENWHRLNYESEIIRFISESDRKVTFFVKEHPSMDGWRDPRFYEALSSFPNVYLIRPDFNSNLLLDSVNNVAVHTGSVGLEALLRGKQVFCLTKNYYSELTQLTKQVDSVHTSDLSKDKLQVDAAEVIEKILNGLWRGLWRPGRDCFERSDINALVAASKKYLSSRQRV